MKITFDDSDFKKKIKLFGDSVDNKRRKGVRDIATTILLYSQDQVPHDKGTLQNSGHVEDLEDESLVGYNTVYAARLHEHPEYHFKKGRKGKYLEDPIKNNLNAFRKYMEGIFNPS